MKSTDRDKDEIVQTIDDLNEDEIDDGPPAPDRNRPISFNLEFLSDVPLTVSAELGRMNITIRQLLSLTQGTVLEIDKLAGEPLEILINGKLVSRGEVIVANEKYAIRLTDIVSPDDNIDFVTKQPTN